MVLTIVILLTVVGCTPSPTEALQRVASAAEKSKAIPDESLMDSLEPGSRTMMLRRTVMDQTQELLLKLRTAVKNAKSAQDMPSLLSSGDPSSSLFLVRDGHSYLLDLRLSGLTMSGLREVRYPSPW